MKAFHIYFITSIICLYGFLLFIWWWRKTGKATEVYKYITVLFFAEFIEKLVFTLLRYASQYGSESGMELHRQIVTHYLWWTIGIPTAIAFGLIVVAMTLRVRKTLYNIKNTTYPTPKIKYDRPKRNVGVLSPNEKTRSALNIAFGENDITCYALSSLLDGFSLIIDKKYVSVLMIDLDAFENSVHTAKEVVEIIRRENPWCVIVAISDSPNVWELFGARRAAFDDYLYLPIDAGILIATYNRWYSKVKRWRHIETKDRRVRKGKIFDRKCSNCEECRKEDKFKKNGEENENN